jgi:uncharacterized protein (DUF934 family)
MPTLIDRKGRRSELPGLRIVSLAEWLGSDGVPGLRALRDGEAPVGVQLEPGDDPAAIAGDLSRLAVVAVNFPVFSDGRGYSSARLLRERLGWQGELRAVGDVLRDQLFFLARCGFDAFALREDQDVAAAVSAFADFSEVYQRAADRGALFERRRAVAGR